MAPPLIQKLVEFDVCRQLGPVAVPMHVHHFCQMDVILSGSMGIRLRNGRLSVLEEGAGTVIPPLALHGFESSGPVGHATFKFHVHPRYAAALGHTPLIVRFPRQQRMIAHSAGQWLRLENPLSVHGATAAATICLVHALESSVRSGAEDIEGLCPPHELWDVLHEVISSPHADWTVHRLAHRCHLSDGHFTKTFIRSFSQTPQRFLLEARIWAAADRLSCGETSVKAVAQATGYASVHSFTRAFKRAMGVSPAAYVKSQGRL